MKSDPLGRALELGLAAVIVVAPLPFGAVGPRGRLGLELIALVLGILWAVRAFRRPTVLPSRWVLAGLFGLLALALFQAAPLGSGAVSLLSPRSTQARAEIASPAEVADAERELLGVAPRELEPLPSISLDRGATASALRTGAALAVLLIVAVTVAASRGTATLALGCLVSAGFQGLYGLLVLVSRHDRILYRPKLYYLDSATGTFVNKNHFACFLAITLACGMALILRNLRARSRGEGRRGLIEALSGEGSRNLLLAIPVVAGLAGLLASFSRAGIALGVAALALTVLAAGRSSGLRTRAVIVLLLLAVAVVPLVQIGADRLVDRYADSAEEMSLAKGRPRVWQDTLAIAAAFPLTGSGFGTFVEVYPLFRSPEIRLLYRHAHNDLVQAVAEGGVLGLLFVICLVAPLARAVVAGISGHKGTLAIGLAAAVTVLALHSLIDFNLHIPANAAVGAVIAGALLGTPWRRR